MNGVMFDYPEDKVLSKRWVGDGHFRLQPENDTMDPIIVNDVEVLGKVVGLFRTYH